MHLLSTIDLQSVREAIASWDATVFRLINTGLAARWLDPVMLAITCLGLGLVQAAVGLGVVIAGAAKKRIDLRRMGYAALVAYAGSGLLSSLLKGLGDRPRPLLVMFDARAVGKPLWIHSFPSGHATTAFAAAFVWAALMPKFRWVFFVLAVLVAVSRVYLGVHFPFDVTYGAILGTLIGIGSARLFPIRPETSAAGAPAEPTTEEAA